MLNEFLKRYKRSFVEFGVCMAIKYSIFSMKRRLSALIMLIIFFVFIIISRLFYLQILNDSFYVERGLTEWLRDLPLIATRGTITDRNGVVLASSYTTYDVYVRPADVENFEEVSKVLSKNLNKDFNEIYQKITSQNLSEIRLAQDIEKETVDSILKEYEDGILFATNTNRNYSYDSMLCQVLGFVGSDNAGQGGLEAFYNEYLSGIDGVSLVESDLRGNKFDDAVTYYENAISGLNLRLTIDFKIQNEIEKILGDAFIQTGAKSVSCLVTEPQTGEILACCTLPSYNLNEVPRNDYETLNKLSRASIITDTFEPGSTFKAIVAAIAIEEGLANKHSFYYCCGYRIINGVKIRCSRRSGHGSQSLEQGLMNSCNCVFMDLIQKIGTSKFYSYLDKLGLTSTTGIDFPGETSAVLMPMPSVTAPDLARMGFGQTISMSALHMAVGVGAVINGGNVMVPHFINEIYNDSGVKVYERQPTSKNAIFSENTSKLMRELLFSVVSKGGGKYAKVENNDIIGGKTGTAQKYEKGAIAQGKYIASFIGFAPYDNPKYLVYVYVDEPVGAYYGGVVAAPIAKSVFEKIFEFDGYGQSQIESINKFVLPTYIGLTLTKASAEIAGSGLQYLVQGDGEYVTGQIPAPGSEVGENDIVLLLFE